MKTNNATPLTESHLASIDNSKQPMAGDHFYTRLRARMEREQESGAWQLPMKPAWLLASLVLLLMMNVLVLRQSHQPKTVSSDNESGIEQFGKAYGLVISTPY
jgi:hypothetical protein